MIHLKEKNNMKTIIVKSAGWIEEILINPDIFEDDIYYEAAICVIERRRNQSSSKIGVIIECFDKKDRRNKQKHLIYNSYYILLGARMYAHAKLLRSKFFNMFGIDLRQEKQKEFVVK